MSGYLLLLRDRHFVGVALIASLTVSSFFIYVANSPFVRSGHYGVSTHQYAMLFGLNAIPLVLLSPFTGRLAARFGVRRVLQVAITGSALAMALVPVLLLAGADSLAMLVGLLLIGYGLNSQTIPLSFVLAMEGHPQLAGSASALIGTMNFVGAALTVALVAPFADGTPLPMALGIAACSIAALGLSVRTRRPAAAARR